MSLIVKNIISSNLKVNYSYFDSEEVFGYLVEATYDIDVSDIQFSDSGGILLSGRSAIRSAYENRNITARIGADTFENGLITSLSFEGSTLLGSEIASVTIEERRRLGSYSSKTFAKEIPSPHMISSFEETYSFNRSGSDYSYNRNVSIQYAQDGSSEFLDRAWAFLSNYYYNVRPSLGYYTDGIAENARFSKKHLGQLNQTIDLIGLKVSLNEDFNSSIIDSANNVSKKIVEKVSRTEAGFLEKTFTVNLTSLSYDAQNSIENAMASIIDDLKSQEESNFGDPYSISKGITRDGINGSMTVSFSTDPNLSQPKITTYTCEKVKQGSNIEYKLNVKYKSTGKHVNDRYDKTLELWNNSKDENLAKVYSLFRESSGLIYEKGRRCNLSKSKGTVNETITYSTNDSYDSGSLPAGIIKYELTIDKDNKTKRSEVIVDASNLQQKLVVSNLDTLGKATVTAVAVAEPSRGIYFAKEFLKGKTSEMESELGESTYYLGSDQFTIDLANATTTRVINFVIA